MAGTGRTDRGQAAGHPVHGLAGGLSALYTYFEPEWEARSLGVFAVLWQLERARALGLPYLYLGYWVRDCRKMSYKDRFRPLEAWDGKQWQGFEAGVELFPAWD